MMNGKPGSTVFFPGAGSFGGEFRPLVQALEPTAWLVKYPGRHGRDFGVPADSFDTVVAACAEQLDRRAPAQVVLVGHSYGAYVAYATALRRQESGLGVSALVVIGATAPGRLEVSERATGTPSEAARYLDSVDPSALAGAPSQDWREIVVTTAVQDLRLLRQFDAGPATRVRCPVVAARGAADPLTTDAGVSEWQRHTDGPFSLRVFSGAHSDFLGSPACATWLRELRADVAGAGVA